MTGDSTALEGFYIIPRRAPCTAVPCVETLELSFSSTGFPHSKRWRTTKRSSGGTCSTSPGCGRAGCREAPGAAQRSAAQAAAGGWGRLRAGAVPRRRRWHSGPRTVQRLSHPPGFPGSPRAVGGTGLPVPPEGTGRNQVRIRRWHSRTPGQGRASSFTD